MTAAILAAFVLFAGAAARTAWAAGPAAAATSRFECQSFGPGAGIWRQPPRAVTRWATRVGLSEQVIESAWPTGAVLAVAVVVASAVVFGVAGLVVAGVLLAAAPSVGAARWAVVVQRRRARALPVLLEDVARGLRSGASLRQALSLSLDRVDATLRPELQLVCDTVDNGGSLEGALETWCRRQPCDGLRLAVAALTLGIDAGGAHGRALDGVAAGLRDRLAVDRELAALTSQARASAGVMAAAPVVFALLAMSADRRTAHILLGTATGLACLVGGLVLDGIAAFWMWRLTRGES